jgi:hypothetical protein
MQENYTCGKVTYMGDVQGPEKVNDTCMKTMHAGTMDRGFTVYMSTLCISFKSVQVLLHFQIDG